MMDPMADVAAEADRPDYELLDAGEGRRLERFGVRVVDRPAPAAMGPRFGDLLTWRRADLRFDGRSGWFGEPAALEPWVVEVDGLTLELRPTDSGGLGLYPEHAANLAWVAARIGERAPTNKGGASADHREAAGAHPPGAQPPAAEPPQVLNLFAHTGLLTLAAARAGARVTHVDGARAAVGWARRNASLSSLDDRPVRWLVDDAGAFVAREARRGRRYDGIVLDPPSFGRAGRRQWRLLEELPALLDGCRAVAAPDAFVLLTAHTAGLGGDELAGALASAFPGARPRVEPLTLEASTGATLDLGWAVRIGG
jgi:23S rRNA (cytosine1962-C5)-methyltransferase